MKCLKRAFALLLAVMMFTFTPVADYIEARTDAEAAFVPALSGPASFVFELLLQIYGVVMGSDMIGNFVDSLGRWVKVDKRYQAVFSQLIADGATWTYGQVIRISQDALDMIHDYLKAQSGYGTETGIEKIDYGTMPANFEDSVTYRNNVDISLYQSNHLPLSAEKYGFTLNYVSKVLSSDLIQADIYVDASAIHFGACLGKSRVMVDNPMRWVDYNTLNFSASDSKFSKNYNFALLRMNGNNVYFSNNPPTWGEFILPTTIYADGSLNYIPFPVYATQAELNNYLATGMIGNPINDYTADGGISIPVESVPDVQMRDLITDAVITIPSTLAGVVDLLSSIKSAVTAKTVAVAAAPAIDVTYGELATDHEDEHAGVYPWLPDITKPLGVISDMVKALSKTLTNVKDNVIAGTKALTGSLADVVTAVKSIPATIATDISSTKVADVGSYAFADLKSLFPFCLPFDLIDFFGALSAPPQAPKFEWKFPGVSRLGIPEVVIYIDLSLFDSVAVLVRNMETLAFIVGLILITRSQMIRG